MAASAASSATLAGSASGAARPRDAAGVGWRVSGSCSGAFSWRSPWPWALALAGAGAWPRRLASWASSATTLRIDVAPFDERDIGPRDAVLVVLVGLARLPRESGQRFQPELLQRAQAVDGVLRRRGLAQRRLVGPRDVDLLLVDAVVALGAVDALLRLLVAEFDDLDALDVAAHRVQVADGVEIAVEPRVGLVGTDVVAAGLELLRGRGGRDCAGCGNGESDGDEQADADRHGGRSGFGWRTANATASTRA